MGLRDWSKFVVRVSVYTEVQKDFLKFIFGKAGVVCVTKFILNSNWRKKFDLVFQHCCS